MFAGGSIPKANTYSISGQPGRRVLLLLFLAPALAFSQKDLKEADRLAAEKNYTEALRLYTKVYEKKKDKAVLLKIADCNFLNENYPQAQEYYSEYFSDTVYKNVPQFASYAKSAKINGDVRKAVKLYGMIYQGTQDQEAKSFYDTYRLYADTVGELRSFNLDSNYNCVELDASPSVDPGAAPLAYLWNFGDSALVEGVKVEHCYPSGGVYTVSLSVRDMKTGLIRDNDTTLTVYVAGPPVRFTVPRVCKQYFLLDFDASATQVYGYEVIDYVWDMDNGHTATGQKVKYKYTRPGIYDVKLTVIAQRDGSKELFSSWKKIEVVENYSQPSKTFTDRLNESK